MDIFLNLFCLLIDPYRSPLWIDNDRLILIDLYQFLILLIFIELPGLKDRQVISQTYISFFSCETTSTKYKQFFREDSFIDFVPEKRPWDVSPGPLPPSSRNVKLQNDPLITLVSMYHLKFLVGLQVHLKSKCRC